MMIGTKEWKKQNGESLDTVKRRNNDAGLNPNPCGGCSACHEMTRIHSMPTSDAWSDDGGEGSDLQKPCASNFFQRNLGNSYMQTIAGSNNPTIQRKCACGGSCESCAGKEEELGKIQTKLTVGPANDVYEQEADRVADQIMRMPDSFGQYADNQSNVGINIQRIPAGGDSLHTDSDIQISLNDGQPLPSSTLQFMEPRFGADFGHVRLHTDQEAHQKASQIQAKAFTYGHHIWLGKGESEQDENLMAHELTHVVQQGGRLKRKPYGDELGEKEKIDRASVRTPEDGEDSERQTSVLYIQRDFAIEPPNPTANAAPLTSVQVQAAIQYNTIKMGSADAALIGTLRDVLGINPDPPVIDADFVNAVARWQAANNVSQDGKLGPDTAAPLFRELRAEGLVAESRTLASLVRRGRVRTGPTYAPNGVVAAPAGAGRHVPFALAAEFEHDPLNGIWASCCEIRQEISWNAAMQASFAATGDPVPHAGFPAAHPANTFIEDRNAGDTIRYGYRRGFGGGGAGNRYVNADGTTLNQANGVRFEGHDDPHMLPADTGQMRFRISVVDVCNENRRIGGTDTIIINW